jgi:hypothetical protein
MKILALVFLLMGLGVSAQAQRLPAQPEERAFIAGPLVAIAAVPNGAHRTAVIGVYASSAGYVAYGVSANGKKVLAEESLTAKPAVDCNGLFSTTCAVSVVVFENDIYLAYVDANTHGLNVLRAKPKLGAEGYEFELVHQDTTMQLTSVPSLTVYQGSIVALFGVVTGPSNSPYATVTFDGLSWTSPTLVEDSLTVK